MYRYVCSLVLFSAATLLSAGPSNRGPHRRVSREQTDAIQTALSDLQAYASCQSSLNIQNADLAYGMRKALVMANLLVQDNGTVNVAVIPTLLSTFIPAQPAEYEANMAAFLNQMNATTWNQIFMAISAPQDQNGLSAQVVRALLSLSGDQMVTDRHAKVAVLAALLAPYNQGPVGDCFAVTDVIRNHREYYQDAVNDYQAIVMKGYLERPVDGATDHFFFLPTLADDDLNRPFTLTASGGFPNTQLSLFDAPGFAAARALMGGNGVVDAEGVMQQLASTSLQVTPAQVIAAMAAILSTSSGTSSDALTATGQYAFSSLTNNTVLRAVEACFAAMAEDRKNDSTRGNINASVATALQNQQLSSAFQSAFANAFNASYRLIYNLNIPLATVSADGSSTDGGFQLYRRSTDPTQSGTRVATPQDFQQLVLDAITATAQQLRTDDPVQTLTAFVSTNEFLKQAFWAYDPSNKSEPSPVKNYQKLSRTPMQSCDGDNPYAVDDIDTQVTYDNNVQSFTPKNAKDLITWALNMAPTAPDALCPMDSPQHAFNYVPKNPDIAAFLQKGWPVGQWLQNRLILPGMQISRKALDTPTAQSIADKLSQQLAGSTIDTGAYQNLVTQLTAAQSNVTDFLTGLVNGVAPLLQLNADQTAQLALAIDAIALQSLPPQDSAQLNQSAVRFAFTNWSEGTKDIYFCAYFNPRTENISFGTIMEDKTELQPMDENAWVNNQQWDVDLMPAAPLPNS